MEQRSGTNPEPWNPASGNQVRNLLPKTLTFGDWSAQKKANSCNTKPYTPKTLEPVQLLCLTWRPKRLSKSVTSRVIIRVTPFRVLITLLVTHLLSPLGLQVPACRLPASRGAPTPLLLAVECGHSEAPLFGIVTWDFPKIMAPYFGVLVIRILLFRVLY